jgi:hypothetical protein
MQSGVSLAFGSVTSGGGSGLYVHESKKRKMVISLFTFLIGDFESFNFIC